MTGHSAPADTVPEPERARLATAWAAAHYFVTLGRREWLFCTGQRAPEIERQLMADRYLFITAWNPPPGDADPQANETADQRLQQRLRQCELAFHPALGCNSRGEKVEPGWFVLDATEEQADALAREFGQGGTLFWPAGGVVRLRMMWPRPPQADGDAHTDWVG